MVQYEGIKFSEKDKRQIMESTFRCAVIELEGKITTNQYLKLLRISHNLDWR